MKALMRRQVGSSRPGQPAAPADRGHRDEDEVEQRRQPEALVGEERGADDVDDDPDRPVLDVLAAEQPLADQARRGREGVPPRHVGVGEAVQEEGGRRPRDRDRDEDRRAPVRAEAADAQRVARFVGAAQPLPPAPAGDDGEEDLQAGVAVEAAVPEQQHVEAASSRSRAASRSR
jgi:hypothetical protein